MDDTTGRDDKGSDQPASRDGIGYVAAQWMRSQHSVLAYLASAVSDFHQAEDLLQEVASIIVANHSKYDRDRSFTAWCIGIAKNVVRSHYRKSSTRTVIVDYTILEVMADAAARLDEVPDDRQSALRECLERLPEKTADLLKLRYENDYKPEQIACLSGMSRANVNVILHRARVTLAECVATRLGRLT